MTTLYILSIKQLIMEHFYDWSATKIYWFCGALELYP